MWKEASATNTPLNLVLGKVLVVRLCNKIHEIMSRVTYYIRNNIIIDKINISVQDKISSSCYLIVIR